APEPVVPLPHDHHDDAARPSPVRPARLRPAHPRRGCGRGLRHLCRAAVGALADAPGQGGPARQSHLQRGRGPATGVLGGPRPGGDHPGHLPAPAVLPRACPRPLAHPARLPGHGARAGPRRGPAAARRVPGADRAVRHRSGRPRGRRHGHPDARGRVGTRHPGGGSHQRRRARRDRGARTSRRVHRVRGRRLPRGQSRPGPGEHRGTGTRGRAYLGAFSVPRTSREGALFLDAVAHAQEQTPEHPSIVNGSIAAAVRGEFRDVQFTSRTKGSELFVNPLMALYFAFELDGLAGQCLYLDRIENTHLMRQVSSAIEVFREEVRQRPPRRIPH
ncbi:LOW QUALITY PROTEIN: conserved hypothetical protein, partial [Streptomyces filamentosus NRRL 15998]